ncbi:hypothetical protein CROQUDRAFT_668088 [Cronartium quercuum f. sp. fusiforme G11]|uniref:Uncharacterized protein n=1 Tax=Cronartium quercuum f. sp. fusiforme G11 TaxID=708437 RepID=A0A9P6THY5_9BASI|nr:hypothetical protein CROQUDRAFT_668088 [Cronartium quercuum f. sp. fusiforme G11]
MNAFSFTLTFFLLGAVTISQARPRHHIRSGIFPNTQCVATLKKTNGNNVRQLSWPAGLDEIREVTLSEGEGKPCQVKFTVNTKICGFAGSRYGESLIGEELHQSQPSSVDTSSRQHGPIGWQDCNTDLMLLLDF